MLTEAGITGEGLVMDPVESTGRSMSVGSSGDGEDLCGTHLSLQVRRQLNCAFGVPAQLGEINTVIEVVALVQYAASCTMATASEFREILSIPEGYIPYTLMSPKESA